MGSSFKIPGFGGGILSAQLMGRSDQARYSVSLRELTNAWVTRYGTIENRPGFFYDDVISNSGNPVRLVRFSSEVAQGILLVFGNFFLRFYKNGAAIQHATTLGAWSIFTSYTHGQVVTYGGLQYLALTINSGLQPDLNPTDWYVQTSTDLELPTPIPQASLATFQTAQINDVMYLVDHGFRPQVLSHFSDTNWTMTNFVVSQGIQPPAFVTVTPGLPTTFILPPTGVTAVGGDPGNPTQFTYYVTSYKNSGGAESALSVATLSTIGAPDAGFPVVVTWTPSGGGVNGYAIYRSQFINGPFGIIGVTSAATFTDSGQETSTRGATAIKTADEDAGGTRQFEYVVTSIDSVTGLESIASSVAIAHGSTPTSADPNIINWSAVTGASSYNIYKSANGVFGFIGTTASPGTQFKDPNIIPATSQQPPLAISMFATPDDYPAVVGTYQQRLFFANTINEPQTVWGSAIGVYSAFFNSVPILDSGSIQFTIAADIRQFIQALVDLGKFIIHTNNGEYTCSGNQAGTLTPTAITLTNTGSAGGALIHPVVVGNTDLFIQEGATRLLDLRYDVQSFSYNGKDLTKFATNLFAGRTIVSMDWQKLPHSIIWCVLDNGVLLGLTYVREDELWAWHYHVSTNGAFEQVCVVTEGNQHVVYVISRRVINGATVRYIENLANRDCLDTVLYSDAYFPDSAQVYDGRNTGSTTITATTGGGWTPTDVLTLTASASTFVIGDIGNAIVFQQTDALTTLVDDQVTFVIIGYTSATVVQVLPERDVPTWARAIALTTWGKAVKDFSGIGHLEGQSLSILADGNVAADPLDPGYPLVTVSGGAFSLFEPSMVVIAGLPVQMDVQTLPVENAQGESIADKTVAVKEVTPIFYNSRGGLYGQDFDHLHTWKQPRNSPEGYPVAPATGPYRVPVQGAPQRTGQICVRLTNPVPWSVSALVLKVEAGQ